LDCDNRTQMPIEKEMQESDVRQARSVAVQYIGLDNKPSMKVAEKLARKGFSNTVIRQVVNDLVGEGIIDDRSYAQAVIRSRVGRKAESAKARINRLLRLGVPEPIARECIQSQYDNPDRESSEASEVLQLKFSSKKDTIRKFNKEERLQFMTKCYRFLLSRGYSFEDAYRATKLLMKDQFPHEESF
jgi:SOS response regulatory protein OraA/RecX